MILNKIQLGGFGGSLLSDNVMNLRKIAITGGGGRGGFLLVIESYIRRQDPC